MILTCDIGTSSLKLGIIDPTGNLLSYTRLPIGRPSAGAWWRAFRQAAKRIPVELRRGVRAVGVSGNAPTLIPVDRRGLPVAEPLMWDEPGGEPLADGSTSSYFLPKVDRFARKYPRLYARTDCFLPSGEFIAFALTGNKTAFIPHAGFEPYYWQTEDLARFRLDRDKFPALTLIGQQAGKVIPRAALLTGIPACIPVFCGGADFLMAILGAGTGEPGLANDRGGTSEAVNYCAAAAVSSSLLRPVPGLKPGTWNIGGFVPNAGRLQALLKDALIGRRGSFEDFQALSDAAEPRAGGVRFQPPRSRFDVGPRFPFASAFEGMTRETSRAEYVLAFFEYTCYSLRRIIEDLERHGLILRALHSSGGLAKNTRLSQLKAIVTGKTVRVPMVEDSELLGNAIVALTGLGEFGTREEAARELVRYKNDYKPDPMRKAMYDELYGQFLHSTIRTEEAENGRSGDERSGGKSSEIDD